MEKTPIILHLDGDAFFASVMQAVYPYLQGKPVVSGEERGIATAISYEAKRRFHIHRGMPIFKIKKLFPECIVLPTDYYTVKIFSNRMFAILREFTPVVEEYSVDEGFADLQGVSETLGMSFEEIGRIIQQRIYKELGITVSIGISMNKTLAKIASSFNKPFGLLSISPVDIQTYIHQVPIEKVWGIGYRTAPLLKAMGIQTAGQFAFLPENWIKNHYSLPFYQTWRELWGEYMIKLHPEVRDSQQSIIRSRTFVPTTDSQFLMARLFWHLDEAFAQAREYHLKVQKFGFWLKTQQFHWQTTEIKLPEPVSYALLARKEIEKAFKKVYQKDTLYRTVGCVLWKMIPEAQEQIPLFSTNRLLEEKMKRLYRVREKRADIMLGSNLLLRKKRVVKPFALPVIHLEKKHG